MPNPPIHNRAATTAARPSASGIAPHDDLSPMGMFWQITNSVSELSDKMDIVLLMLNQIERNVQNARREVTLLKAAAASLIVRNKSKNPSNSSAQGS